MAHDEETPMRQQLVAARTNIIAQLDELNFRATGAGFARRGGPPNYRSVIAELEGQLNEINALLDADGPPDA